MNTHCDGPNHAEAQTPDVAELVQRIAAWIPADARLVVIGSGRAELESLLPPAECYAVDRVDQDGRTLVVDLNQADVPQSLLRKVEFATLLGVIEHLPDPTKLLRTLAAQGITVACSYSFARSSCSPHSAARAERRNDLRPSEFHGLLNECGFEVARTEKLGNHGLYWLKPMNVPHSSAATTNIHGPKKRKLVLSGFFGRGNTGDEALLQVQYEKLSPQYDIVISVEPHGAFPGYRDWYPYRNCQIIQHAETRIFLDDSIAALHIGGGNLPLGFNGAQVFAACAAGKPVFATGVDSLSVTWQRNTQHAAWLSQYLAAYNFFSVRSRQAWDRVQPFANHVHLGADWAFDLQADNSDEVPFGLTLVVLREIPVHQVSPKFRAMLAELVRTLESRNRPYAFFPFCPQDERFLSHFDATWGQPLISRWWNPSRMKQYIAQAELVISVGRLHPLIIAGSTHTPCVFSELQAEPHDEQRTVEKIKALRADLPVAYMKSLPELTQWLQTETPQLAKYAVGFNSEYSHRFQDMTQRLASSLERSLIDRNPWDRTPRSEQRSLLTSSHPS